MKIESIMLCLLIPRSHSPGNNINVYLEPLIDELKILWDSGSLLMMPHLMKHFKCV